MVIFLLPCWQHVASRRRPIYNAPRQWLSFRQRCSPRGSCLGRWIPNKRSIGSWCELLPLGWGAGAMAALALAFAVALLFLCACSLLLRWNELRYRRKGLPRGTMGWPLFGETMEFLKQGPSFMTNQRARYGSLFKSHILGCPTVVSMDPEVNRYLLMNEGKGLVPGYPQSMLDILGRWNIAAVHSSLHRAIRGVLLSLVGPAAIREQLLPKIDQFMRSHTGGWGGQTVDIQEKVKEVNGQTGALVFILSRGDPDGDTDAAFFRYLLLDQMAFLLSLKVIAGVDTGHIAEAFYREFHKLVLGTLSLPIDLPGTSYRGGFQARQKITGLLRKVIEDRRASPVGHDDMLGSLLQSGDKSRLELTDDQMIDLLITIIYSGYETISTTSMMAVKYLHDHPKVLQELRNEHMEIRKRKTPEEAIDWNDYKSMNFTRAVILETMRLATIVNGVLRKTTEDMEIKGFLIPKGWKIYVYTRETNYDHFRYPEPLTFNPWRWKDRSMESHHHFMMFGGGSRLCPGKELGLVQMATFLHYFLTRYQWEEAGGDEIVQFPRVEAPKGLQIRVSDN